MTKKNKIMLLISSIVIILPSVAALILHGLVETKVVGAWHFSWALPVVLVAVHVILHLLTFRENERVEQNQKIVNIGYWIIPVLSVYISAVFMLLSLGYENILSLMFSALFGTIFIVFGNYMPKAKQNRTFGIKIRWTLANEDNWAATHRACSKVWVVSGILALLCGFLPDKIAIPVLLLAIIPAVIIPIAYSYWFYKKQLREGTATKEDYASYPKQKTDKKIAIISSAVVTVIIVLVCLMMFVGKITYTVGDESLEVKTTYGGKMEISYDDIDSVEYRPEGADGMRVSGFASATMLYGWFKNDELGNYTRYTYTGSGAVVVIYIDDGIIVLGDRTDEATEDLYDLISDKIMNRGEWK